jgi:tetratricopeptide (TPR) repeat protein
LAQIYLLQEKWGEGIPLLTEFVNLADNLSPRMKRKVPKFRAMLGAALVELNRYEEAEAELLEAFEQLKTTKGEEEIWTQTVAQNLIDLYEAWGKPEKAVKYREFLKGSGL